MNPTTYTQGQTFYNPNTGQADGAVNFNANTGARLATGQTFQQITPNNSMLNSPIPAANLTSTMVPTATIQQRSTAQNNLQTAIDSTFTGQQTQTNNGQMVNTYSDGTTNAPQTPNQQRSGFQSTIQSLFQKLGTKGARTAEIQNDEGVQTKKDEVRGLENQALALDNSFNRRIEAIRGNGGSTKEQSAADISELQAQQNSRKADLAIQSQVAQGNYQSAYEIAKSKIDAEFEPIQTQLEGLRMQIDLFQNDMTASERMKAEQAYQTKRDAADFARQKSLINYRASFQASQNNESLGVSPKVLATTQFKAAQNAAMLTTELNKAIGLVTKYGNFELVNGTGRGEINNAKVQIRSLLSTALEQGVVQPGEASAFEKAIGSLGNPLVRQSVALGSLNAALNTSTNKYASQASALQGTYGVTRDQLDFLTNSQAPTTAGSMIRVKLPNGTTGTVPLSNFDPNTMIKI